VAHEDSKRSLFIFSNRWYCWHDADQRYVFSIPPSEFFRWDVPHRIDEDMEGVIAEWGNARPATAAASRRRHAPAFFSQDGQIALARLNFPPSRCLLLDDILGNLMNAAVQTLCCEKAESYRREAKNDG
jgi:hypothetical protein